MQSFCFVTCSPLLLDPKHGEKWTQVSKALENITVGGCRLSADQLVKKVRHDSGMV